MKTNAKRDEIRIIAAMAIFGTIGLVRRLLPGVPSGFLAFCRCAIGTLFLLLLTATEQKHIDWRRVKQNLLPLAVTGFLLGFNWILLFEAYNYTSVAVATLCYYMAPTIIILLSPLVVRERLTPRKLLCVAISLAGMVCVSGILRTGLTNRTELIGIGFGLASAVLYAGIVLTNKKIVGLSGNDRTVLQLGISAVIMFCYSMLFEQQQAPAFTLQTLILLALAGILHTGVAYRMYFGALATVPAQTSALLSYIDPVVALILSATVLHEGMDALQAVGAALILCGAVLGELKTGKTNRIAEPCPDETDAGIPLPDAKNGPDATP